MAIQKRNDEMVNLLGSDFQRRYESGFAWRTACSTFQALTGLRGFWPMSALSSTGAAYDQSGNGRTLTYNGAPTYDFDGLAPYIRFGGAGFLSRADEAGLDILGTEAYVGTPGLTMGGWFRPEDIANGQAVMTKWSAAAGNYSYNLAARGDLANDPVVFTISSTGANSASVTSTVGYAANTWYFFAARFDDAKAGAELAVWVNSTQTTAATAFAAIFNGNADLRIANDMAGNTFTGRASLCFLCAAALPDATVWAIHQHTKALFKV